MSTHGWIQSRHSITAERALTHGETAAARAGALAYSGKLMNPSELGACDVVRGQLWHAVELGRWQRLEQHRHAGRDAATVCAAAQDAAPAANSRSSTFVGIAAHTRHVAVRVRREVHAGVVWPTNLLVAT